MSNRKLLEDLTSAVNNADIMTGVDLSKLFMRAIYALQACEWNTDMEAAPRDGTWFVIDAGRDGDPIYEVGKYDQLMSTDYKPEDGTELYRKVESQIYDWTGFNNFHRARAWRAITIPDEDQ